MSTQLEWQKKVVSYIAHDAVLLSTKLRGMNLQNQNVTKAANDILHAASLLYMFVNDAEYPAGQYPEGS